MAAVGGMIASAVGKEIASKLGELMKEEIALLRRFEEDVAGMAEKMKDLEAVMSDADDRLRHGESYGAAVGRWLTKFKSIAYDVEDVLDEFNANELIRMTQSKLKLFFSRNNQLLQRMTMTHNMKRVREKIDKIEKEGQTLNLACHEAWEEGRSKNKETFAAIGDEGFKTGMIGRDNEQERIISLLLRSEASKVISVISIVGFGGIGKTTLAQSVFADKRVSVFDVKAWVHVSEKFDLQKIGSRILKRVNNSINLDTCGLQFVLENLEKELATRRYLIVLDDLWEEGWDNLDELKRMLQYGRKGSRIVVTTRNQSVVQTLSTGFLAKERKICPVPESEQINLGVLSPDDCWKLMKQRAMGADCDGQSGLEEIGRQIADKCGGLPLVANSLGQVMSGSRTVQEWKKLRDAKVDLGSGDQKDTLERLMLSYHYMKMEFKMCFTYLAVFSKGFVMDNDRLIQLWKALGYIPDGNTGQRCINYLLGMSFLNIARSSSVNPSPVDAKAPQELSMHDLVHDLASTITANEFFILDANAPDPRTWNRARYCRHAQLINYQNQFKVFRYLPTKIRSLHFRDSGKLQLPRTSFSRSKYIRVLDISGRSVVGQSTPSNFNLSGCSVEGQSTPSRIVLPSSIHQLKLLRYLDATALPITSLPMSFHTLQYMQTLILSKCSLETLPDNICSLHKLCYFDLSSNSSLEKLPMSLGKLSQLCFLNLSECSILQELPESICELTCLEHLDMSECRAIQKLPDGLANLRKLMFLNLSGCSKITKLPDNISLESLEHLNLSNCHDLQNLPQDFGNLQNLVLLNLSYCYKVRVLPESFCHLKHLKDLDLSDCHDLRELPECFGDLCELESLNLTSCYKLDQLPESLCKLFKLRHFNVSYCMKLRELPSSFGDLQLQTLDISFADLRELPDSIINMTSLTQFDVLSAQRTVMDKADDIRKSRDFPGVIRHDVHQKDDGGCSSIVELAQLTCRELVVRNLHNVKHPEDAERAKLQDKLDLRGLHLGWRHKSLRELANSVLEREDKSVLERLLPPRTLEVFFLAGYMSKDFPNWMSHISSYLPSLTFVRLCDLQTCDTLPPFGWLPNLRSLSMKNIPNIRKIGKEFYGDGGACMKLRDIQLASMENLVEWWTTRSGEETEEFLIPNLHRLHIEDCPKLKFLPYPPRSMSWYLENSDEVLPEGGFGKLSSATLPFKMMISTLETFAVTSCSSLTALPEAVQCFTGLRELRLTSLKNLETLPEWLGHLTSLQVINIKDCPMVTFLPESMKKLAALRELSLKSLKDLETLPEWLGHLTSLQVINIKDCPMVTFLPESMKKLAALKTLWLESLETLPEWLGHLTSLEVIGIEDCPTVTFLPESMKKLAALRELYLEFCKGLHILPEWIGQLISLQKIGIHFCPNLTSLPESIQNLTALKELNIWGCPSLVERCRGEDAHKISHIPEVILRYVRWSGSPSEEASEEEEQGLASEQASEEEGLGSASEQASKEEELGAPSEDAGEEKGGSES